MTTYLVCTLSGAVLDNGGKGYVSPRAAQQAANRRGLVPVETRPVGEALPHPNDAAAWDAMRTRRGHPDR